MIERLRQEVRALDYEPLDDVSLEQLRDRSAFGVWEGLVEGLPFPAQTAALHAMMFEERTPGVVWQQMVLRYAEAVAGQEKASRPA